MDMWKLIDEIKKTVAFIGEIDDKNKIKFKATGFLVHIQNIHHLVTAKHVLLDQNGNIDDSWMLAFFNSKDGKIASRSIEEIKRNFSVDWIFHENKEVDIAIIPFGLDPQKDDVKTIPDDMFIPTERLFELYDVFFLSYQPGIDPQKRISPIIRTGTISVINDDKTFYIDASAFPGNSGSPVFLKPSPIRYDEEGKGISIGGDKLGGKFIGIIGEYIPYREIARSDQTGRPRVIFEENTGLSRVWSVPFIRQILDSGIFKEQLNKLVKK